MNKGEIVNKKTSKKSPLEEAFDAQLRSLRVNKRALKYEREYVFHPTRKWRFDFAIPSAMLAIEVDGGLFRGGRHNTGKGMLADMEKFNEALCLGWRVLRVGGPHIKSGEAIEWTKQLLGIKS